MQSGNSFNMCARKRIVYYILVALIPVFVIFIASISGGIYPFGDKLLAHYDMQYQYVDFFMWFHNVLHGKDSLDYSFYAGMGGNTIALFAYYLASPLNLLSYFFPADRMGEFLTVLIDLKLVLCSISAYIFMRKRFGILSLYGVMIATSYAFIGYNILQCTNVMWLDGVIVLPIIALGIYRCVCFKKQGLYFISLFYGIASNWYIGYMLCLSAVLYFVLESIFLYYDENKRLADLFNRAVLFAVTSIASFFATSFLFIPQALYMARVGKRFDWSIFVSAYNFSFLEGFRDLFLEPDKLTLSSSNPPIFTGSLILLLIVILLISKEVKRYKKVVAAIYLVGFMFVFAFKPLDYFFSVLRVSASHNYRYAFVYSFFMVVMASVCLKEINVLQKKSVTIAAAIIVVTALVFDMIRPYTETTKFFLSCFLVGIIGITIVLKMHDKFWIRGLANIVLLCCLVLECSVKLHMEVLDRVQSAAWYREYNQEMAESLEEIQQADTGYYRIDKNLSRAGNRGGNESLAFGYSSIAQYSSAGNVEVAALGKTVGYSKDSTVVPYIPILAMDSLLGNKYIYSRTPVYGCELIQENILDGINVYYNSFALPLGYQVNSNEGSYEFGNNALENHELFYSRLLGKEVPLYCDSEILSQQTDYSTWTEWEIKATKTGALYSYFSEEINSADIYVNDEYRFTNSWFEHPVLFLGEFTEGDIVKVKANVTDGSYQEGGNIYVGTLDIKVFESSINSLKAKACQINKMKNSQVSAVHETNEAGTLLLTIPYENGWSVKVNGKSVLYHRTAEMFIGIDVQKGQNNIEMIYSPPGKRLGILITTCTFIAFGCWELYRRRKKGVGDASSQNG